MSCLHQPEDRGIHQAPEEEYQEEDRDSEQVLSEAEVSEEDHTIQVTGKTSVRATVHRETVIRVAVIIEADSEAE